MRIVLVLSVASSALPSNSLSLPFAPDRRLFARGDIFDFYCLFVMAYGIFSSFSVLLGCGLSNHDVPRAVIFLICIVFS